MSSLRKKPWYGAVLTVVLLATLTVAPSTADAVPADGGKEHICQKRVNQTYKKLLECATLDGALVHQAAFQEIADEHDGTRASGTPGYEASVDYVAEKARSWGYDVTIQEFEFPFFEELSPAVLENLTTGEAHAAGEDFFTMTYSAAGDVTATAEGVALELPPPDEPGVVSGCEADHFDDFTEGNIAIIQRGTCTFAEKAVNAEEAGASAVVIFNEGQPGRTEPFAGTLGEIVVDIPVVSTSFDIGTGLLDDEVRVAVDAMAETQVTWNVLADSQWGRDDNVVVAGAHLDSVLEGPGINDNGSGSAALLEIADAMRKVKPENGVRFAWWGAEEFGLLGSDHYVFEQTEEELEDIALYLNFDMVASPNYVRFVYDGSGDAFGLPGPEGSASIEDLFVNFYAHRGLAAEPTEISFRSDYAAFFDMGIPFGGLFTGAEGVKSAEEEAIYGGTAGEAYDPCYHQACDTIDNLDHEVFDLNIDAIAFAVLTYAYSTEEVNGEPGRPVPGRLPRGFGTVEIPEGAGSAGAGGGHHHRHLDH